MKKYTVEELENLSEEEVEKIAKEIIGEQQSGMAASIDGVIFVFNAVNKFEVSDQKLYLNVIHPEGAMYMECVEEVQPDDNQWQRLHENLLDAGFGSAVMMCIGEGENFYDFHIRHSNSLIRLFYTVDEEGDLYFFDSEEIQMH